MIVDLGDLGRFHYLHIAHCDACDQDTPHVTTDATGDLCLACYPPTEEA